MVLVLVGAMVSKLARNRAEINHVKKKIFGEARFAFMDSECVV
jgi:hypothetical protein